MRNLLRLFRLNNLLMFTLAVILLYLVKMLTNRNPGLLSNPENSTSKLGRAYESRNNEAYFIPQSMKKIDWHNYTQIHYEAKREGIGEQGRPAQLPKEDADLEKALYEVNGFNGALSDLIPLNRSLPDIRHPACKSKLYIESLPTVSVVVPFHNEHWSTLLRTAYSVLYRSPAHLIKEIFLVDDASTKVFLKKKLEAYLSTHMPKVSVLRLQNRSGLITARLLGARRATGDVLVFLDSHTEASVNWLPPLLEPIALEPHTVVCPFIDVIAHDTFEYRAQDGGARGAFDWELYYKRLPLLPRDEDHMPEPFESPVMAGGLFAISRAFFWRLGGYDPGLDIWGGEQYELSFKIWQCGGRLVDAACSRVGHIYRSFAPFPNPGHGDFVAKNYRRVAEVWMDEYAGHVYARRPHYRRVPPGDLARQRALRDELHCRPFHWFMTQVAFDLMEHYPPVEPAPFANGRIRPAQNPDVCIDAARGTQLAEMPLNECAHALEKEFTFTWHKDIRVSDRDMCWDLPESGAGRPVRLFPCHRAGGNQLWRYTPESQQIQHVPSSMCVQQESKKLVSAACQHIPSQRWTIDHVDDGAMARWHATAERVTGPLPYP